MKEPCSMTRRKYGNNFIEKVCNSIKNGMSIKDASSAYGIDRRRIYEFIKQTPNISEVSNAPIENETSISSTTFSDLSVEDILSRNGYSPSEWEVVSIRKNTWDDSSGKTHYQTKLHVIKKEIESKYILPRPINVTLNKRNTNTNITPNKKSKIKCAVILPDMQCGFRRDISNGSLSSTHDRRAMMVALKLIRYLNPDRVIMLGDNLDLAEMSTKYLTTPDFYFTTQAALVELSWWLAEIRFINDNTKIDYIGGNHENRLNKYLNEKALSMYGLKAVNNLKGPPAMSIENLLSLDNMDIEYHQYPSGRVAINNNLICIHGEVAKGGSGSTVSEVVKSARVSTIQGHIHRHEVATKTTWDAKDNFHMYTAASFGCLCKIDPGAVPGMLHRQNWQQGIGVVWYEEDGAEQFRMEFVPIIDGRAIYGDDIFESESEEHIASTIEKSMKFKLT